MPTRNIVLTDRQDRLVANLVDSGRYQNASEVLREGLRLVEAMEDERLAKLRSLLALVDQAEAEVARGAFKDFESAEAAAEHMAALGRAALKS